MKGYDYSHGVKLGKNLMLHSLILRMSMIFKLGKEKIPFMGPPTVKEMFGTEGFMQKIIRLLAKGAVAAGAASVVFLETEAVCPWPRHAICPWPKARELPFALSEHGDLQTGTLLAAPSTAVGGRRHLRSGEAMLPLVVESPRGRRQELLYNFL
ncbi:unnamed protein product [Effrenium voratum]|nr:unnamed protein product [Effrenium voratum]